MAFAGQAEEAPVTLDMSAASAKERAFFNLYDMIETGIKCGAFNPDMGPLQTAKSIWAGSHGLVMIMIHFPNFESAFDAPAAKPGSPDAMIRRHADFLIRGISA